jgi:COMPASS component SWD1
VTIWDLASEHDPPRPHSVIRFDGPVSSASFHPRNRCTTTIYCSYMGLFKLTENFAMSSKIVLVLLEEGYAYIVDLRREHPGQTELVELVADVEGEDDSRSRWV